MRPAPCAEGEATLSIWFTQPTLEALNESRKMTMVDHLGIEFLEIGDDYIKAKMPVDHRTIQPFGLLHGGASAALAETLGSVAANLCVDRKKKVCVGLEINANHIRPVSNGFVYGTARPAHIGESTQVWEIRIHNEQDKLVCISRLTLAVVERQTQHQ
jgi:1,4-dihydroxy-2-naphthoyl-CoA hydrolase